MIAGGVFIPPLLAPAGLFISAAIGFAAKLGHDHHKAKQRKAEEYKPTVVCLSNPHMNDYKGNTVVIGPNLIFMGPKPLPEITLTQEIFVPNTNRNIVVLHP